MKKFILEKKGVQRPESLDSFILEVFITDSVLERLVEILNLKSSFKLKAFLQDFHMVPEYDFKDIKLLMEIDNVFNSWEILSEKKLLPVIEEAYNFFAYFLGEYYEELFSPRADDFEGMKMMRGFIAAFQKKQKLPKKIQVIIAEDKEDYLSDALTANCTPDDLDGKSTALLFFFSSEEYAEDFLRKKSIVFNETDDVIAPLGKTLLKLTDYTIKADLEYLTVDRRKKRHHVTLA